MELLITAGIAILVAIVMVSVTSGINGGTADLRRVCNGAVGPSCAAASATLAANYSAINTLIFGALLLLPAVVGVFVGAPLIARELEAGTARFVWTQSITRIRWLSTKLLLILAVICLSSALLAVVSGLMIQSQLGMFTSRWASFDIQGPALVAYVVFALALGAASGAIVRRTVPAMALTALLYLTIRLTVFMFVRPNFIKPLEADISKPLGSGDNWVLGQRAVDLSGNPVSDQFYNQLVANAGALQGSLADYLRAHDVIALQIYQPESRFWLFQSLEALLFVVLAAGLLTLSAWSIRRA